MSGYIEIDVPGTRRARLYRAGRIMSFEPSAGVEMRRVRVEWEDARAREAVYHVSSDAEGTYIRPGHTILLRRDEDGETWTPDDSASSAVAPGDFLWAERRA